MFDDPLEIASIMEESLNQPQKMVLRRGMRKSDGSEHPLHTPVHAVIEPTPLVHTYLNCRSSGNRKRRYNDIQSTILDAWYATTKNVDAEQKKVLAELTQLTYKQIERWFESQRKKEREGGLEVDSSEFVAAVKKKKRKH